MQPDAPTAAAGTRPPLPPRPEPLTAPPVESSSPAAPPAPERRTTVPYVTGGLPAAEGADEPEQSVQAAIEASTRAESSLSASASAMHQLTTGLTGAREAQEQLVAELGRLRLVLGSSNERRLMLERRLELVSEERDRAVRQIEELSAEAERERAFLVEEQDRFLNSMIEDHDSALAAVIRERDEAREQAARVAGGVLGIERHNRPTSPNLPKPNTDALATQQALQEARHTIEKLMAERDRARDVLRRLQSQRDEAQDAVDRLSEELKSARSELHDVLAAQTARLTEQAGERVNQDAKRTDPVAMYGERPTFPAPHPAFADALAASRAKTPPVPPPADVLAAAQPSRSPPPEQLRAALFSSGPPQADPPAGPESLEDLLPSMGLADSPAAAPSGSPVSSGGLPPLPSQSAGKRPALKQKPDPASHSLGGYSKGPDDIEPEQIDAIRLPSSKPPR